MSLRGAPTSIDSPYPPDYKPPHPEDEEATAFARPGDQVAQSPNDEPDDAALRARLDKLSKTLGGRGKVQDEQPPLSGNNAGMGDAMGAGFRVVAELVAGVVVGGGLGWVLDHWLNTKPVLMIVLGCLGLVGGFWNIIRAAMLPPRGKNSG